MVDRMTRGAKKGGKRKGGWLRRVKWDAVATLVVLIFIFLLAMFIRSYWYWGPAVDKIGTYGDEAYLLSGNDPNYHKHTVDYIQETHHHLITDPMLNYPQTGANPNPPVYAWSIALMGYLLSPFYGGDVHMATWIVMEYAAALWAALTIFPTYVFARDMFGRKTGIIAAFFLAIMAGNVERTPVGFSDHDGIMMFFVVLSFLFMMRAMRALKSGTFIKSYTMAGDITDGFLRWARENRKAILNAVMAGIAIAAVGLTWKGVAYVYAIIFIYFIVHMTILKIKKEDNLGLSMVVLISLGLPLLIMFPYYYIPDFWGWFESLAYIFVGVAIFALLFMFTRDIPWLVVLPSVFGLVAGGMAVISYVYPEMFQMVVSLSGYFVKTKLYTTIAEAQAPDFSRMVFSYGIITTYLALVGVGWAAWKLPSEKWRNDYIVTIIWAGMAIYMAMSAVRFMYNATPVFAIMSAWITYEIIRICDFGTMWRNYSNLRRGQRWYAFKESVKPRHVVVSLFVVGLIVLPNTFYGIDAGIPYETKVKYDKQLHEVYDQVLPEQIRGVSDKEYKSLGSSTWFLGSFGTAYPSDYWVDGLYWLADQDNQSLPEDRPAFISWWDYGHWAVHMGQHPSAADNFQNSFQWAGQFISAQNESETEALMVVKIWEGVRISENDKSVDDILLDHMTQEEFDLYLEYWSHPTDYVDLIHKDPLKYGPRTDDIDIYNARYLLTTRVLMDIMGAQELDQLLWELEYSTGKTMRYFAVDSRLMPYSPTNTGIFYAPIKLSDQNIDDFLYVNAISKTGGSYKLGSDALQQAQEDDPDFAVSHYEIVYQKPFFNSMFYKAYIGWQPLDLDINEMAVPIVTNPADVGRQDLEVRSIPPLQGWGMEHYKLEYRTVYWNPNTTDLEAHREEWEVIPPDKAAENEANGDGTVDWLYRGLYSGVFFLKFYHGAYVNGTVTTSEGEPVVNATVTVYDDLKTAKTSWPGVPHGSVKTDALGRYSILAPPGNDTIVVSNGGQGEGNEMREALLMQRDIRILSMTTVNITDEQAMRLPTDENGDGTLDYNVRHDVKVEYGQMQGKAYWDMDLDQKWTEGTDVTMTGDMTLLNTTLGIDRNVTLTEDGDYLFENIIPNTYSLLLKYKGLVIGVKEVGVEVGDNLTEDAVLPASYVTGNVTPPASSDGQVVDTRVVLDDRGGTPAAVWTNDTVNGTFVLGPVYPGNYTIRTDDPEYGASAADVDIDLGTNVSLNMSLERTAGLTGNLTYSDGTTAGKTVVIFSTTGTTGSDVKVVTDTAGQYTAHLAKGNYTIYAINMKDGQTQVATDEVKFGEDAMTKDLTMWPSIKVNGTAFFDQNGNGTYDGARYDYLAVKKNLENPDMLYMKGEEAAEVEVVFQGANGNYTMRSNKGGYFEAMLPVGKYTIRAYSTTTNETYTYLDMVDLKATTEKDLPLTKGTLVRGTVYQDLNDDDLPDPDEYIVGIDVIYELVGLPDEKGVADTVPDLRSGIDHMSAITDADGVYSMFLTTNASYRLSVNVPGYEAYSDLLSIPVDQMQRNVKLTPSNITVSGLARTMGEGTATGHGQSVDLTFRATYRGRDATATSGEDGSYNVQLTPGIYRVTVDAFKQQDGASVAYSFSTELNVSIGSGPIALDVPLATKYKVSGKAFFDLNGDGLASRDEVRGPSIRFVDQNGLVSSATASSVDGKFETYLSLGKYSVYGKLNEIGITERIMTYLDGLEVDGEETLTVQLHESVRLDGVIYFDQNRDGKMDGAEPEGTVLLNISDITGMDPAAGPAGAPMVNITGDLTGSYSIHVPSNRTYMLWVDSLVPALTESDVTMDFIGTNVVKVSEDQRQFMQDIGIEMTLLVSGQVIWDGSGSSEGIPGVQVAFGNATAMTNTTGNFSLFVRPDTYVIGLTKDGFVTPESAVEEETHVNKANNVFTLYMEALNVSYGGVAFVDSDGDGNRTAGELGFAMDIVFKPTDVDMYGEPKENVSARTNRRGEFKAALPVGNYEVLIDAVDEDTHRHYVFDDMVTVTPLGGPITNDIPLTLAALLKARILYNGTAGDGLHVPLVNISFKDLSRDVRKDFTNVTSDALLYLQPSSFYIVESTFEMQEDGKTVTYRLVIEGLDMNGSRTMDLYFEKDRVYATELTWDESERVRVHQNETVLYNVLVKNVGNEADTFDIQMNPPSGWVVTAEEAGTGSLTELGTEVKKVYLALDQEYRFQVRLNVSKIANADDNPITVSLMSETQGASNATTLHVDVFQEYNLTFGETSTQPMLSNEGAVEYNVIVKNNGNGEDSVTMSVSPISGWNITMEPDEFDVAASGTQNVLVRVKMEESGRPVETVLYVKAHSDDGETIGEQELDVTFPDLTANVTVSGDKVEDTKTQPAPGFEAFVLIAAIGVAVVIIKRRARKEDGGGWG